MTPGTLNSVATTNGNLNIGYLTGPANLNDWAILNVPQGAELSLALTNLPATFDLELFGPGGQQLQGAPSQTISGVTDTVPSVTPGATTEATPGSQDLPVTPPPGDQLLAVSNNPGAQSQYIQTAPLAGGTYVAQVSGYNGAYSSQPYLLQANILGGAAVTLLPVGRGDLLPELALADQASATGSPAIPNGVNTLFLVNTQRLSAAFPSDASTIMSDLQNIGLRLRRRRRRRRGPRRLLPGGADCLLDVEHRPLLGRRRQWCGHRHLVCGRTGSGRTTPPCRTSSSSGPTTRSRSPASADGAAQSNERDYGASTFAGENNPEADALSLGYYFSDDPYAASTPLGVGSATLYTPQLAVGRLVESAAEIESALGRFSQTTGDLNATAGLTTGYSFLSPGAQAVSANLAADGLTATALIDQDSSGAPWSASDLKSALVPNPGPGPGIDSVNAHFDYSRLLPASGNASSSTTSVNATLFSTSDVRNNLTSYAGRLLCRWGATPASTSSDAEVAASGVPGPVDDWAKTFADSGALWVANTGYGYADTDTVAYSAKLMAEFARNLSASAGLTIGEALAAAKQQYAAGNALLSPYDLKALMESTFYGLPMYRLNNAGSPVTPAGPPSGPAANTLTAGPATGLTAAPVALNLGNGTGVGQLSLVNTANGSYYQVNGSSTTNPGTQVTELRPVEPLATLPVSEPNLVAHGALVTGLTSTDTSSFSPVYSQPAVGSANSTPPAIGNAAFPGTLQRVSTYGAFTDSGTTQASQLDLVAGQFFPNPGATGTGTQRIFNAMAAHVFYLSPASALASDYTPATINTSQAVTSSNAINFAVQVTPSSADDQVAQVLVLYADTAATGSSTPTVWTPVNLTPSADHLTWTALQTHNSTSNVQYIVETVDGAGNVAVSNNEGVDFNGAPQPAISISLSGSALSNGYYTGPVTANIVAPTGSTFVLDGSAPASVPAGGVVVTRDGAHTLTVSDTSGHIQTQAFAISTAQTTTTVSSNANPSLVGQPVTYTATVSPSSPGAGSPPGRVEFVDGPAVIPGCGQVPLAGSTATCQVTYTSPSQHRITATYLGGGGVIGSTSSPVAQMVSQSATTTSISSSVNPSVVGQLVCVRGHRRGHQPWRRHPDRRGAVPRQQHGDPRLRQCVVERLYGQVPHDVLVGRSAQRHGFL